jgi:uncharacterized membrane protein
LTGLSALALALSAYLSWHHLMGGSVIGCGGGSPCEQVLSSRWSTVGGVLPVTGLAAGAYLAILVASLFMGPATEPSVQRLAWNAMLVLVGAAAGSAVWFTIVQKWVIGSFCSYCMATHITGLLLAALVAWRSRTPPFVIRHSTFMIVGLALAGLLAVCQASFTPPPVSRAGASQNNLPALDPRAVPLVGSPNAPHIVNLLYDYKCPHCQHLHFMLHEAVRRFGGKLAVALCPTPLSTNCNPHVPRDVDEFKDACELAKVGLAVWRANREAFPAFERWMFTWESGDRWQPRSLENARAKAVELVGQTKFNAAWADPWIDRCLQTSVKLFGATGSNAIPKLVFGSRWVIPQPSDTDGLVSILKDHLGVATN